MLVEDGEFIMQGLSWNDPYRIRSWQELVNWVDEVGFLPFFSNQIKGFSAEEHVSPVFWWTGDPEQDPWEWREMIARSHQLAYGKFFDQKAGFISKAWLPYFANSRRSGYDFDSLWEDGHASRREKKIMDFFLEENEDGDTVFKNTDILSTELKKKAGFGKGGEKNYPGIMTGLQMKTYLVISDFRKRRNKKGSEYGMSVSVPLPPEAIWGRELVASAYTEKPAESWERICGRIKELYPDADDKEILKIAGKKPEE